MAIVTKFKKMYEGESISFDLRQYRVKSLRICFDINLEYNYTINTSIGYQFYLRDNNYHAIYFKSLGVLFLNNQKEEYLFRSDNGTILEEVLVEIFEGYQSDFPSSVNVYLEIETSD